MTTRSFRGERQESCKSTQILAFICETLSCCRTDGCAGRTKLCIQTTTVTLQQPELVPGASLGFLPTASAALSEHVPSLPENPPVFSSRFTSRVLLSLWWLVRQRPF
jgi:hypothetical protein